jgi:hypothetical protein
MLQKLQKNVTKITKAPEGDPVQGCYKIVKQKCEKTLFDFGLPLMGVLEKPVFTYYKNIFLTLMKL